MKEFTTPDLIKLLWGTITPIGETNYDIKCLENISNWKPVISLMLDEMFDVLNRDDKYLLSVKNCSNSIEDYLKEIYEHLGNYFDKQGNTAYKKNNEKEFIYPLVICEDRYSGCYSGGKYTAWNCYPENIPEDIFGDDLSCAEFWREYVQEYEYTFGIGNTVYSAIDNLKHKISKK